MKKYMLAFLAVAFVAGFTASAKAEDAAVSAKTEASVETSKAKTEETKAMHHAKKAKHHAKKAAVATTAKTEVKAETPVEAPAVNK